MLEGIGLFLLVASEAIALCIGGLIFYVYLCRIVFERYRLDNEGDIISATTHVILISLILVVLLTLYSLNSVWFFQLLSYLKLLCFIGELILIGVGLQRAWDRRSIINVVLLGFFYIALLSLTLTWIWNQFLTPELFNIMMSFLLGR